MCAHTAQRSSLMRSCCPFATAARRVWKDYFPGVSCIIFIVDAHDRDRFEEARKELNGLLSCEELQGVPFLVFLKASFCRSFETGSECLESTCRLCPGPGSRRTTGGV